MADPPLSIDHEKTLETNPNQSPSSYTGFPFTDCSNLRLLWNLIHLCNVTTSGVSAYLSLEALARTTCHQGNLQHDVSFAYQPGMRAQAIMLNDVCRNLEATRDALLQSPLHQICMNEAAYDSLIRASHGIPVIVHLIPQMLSPFLDAPKLNEHCMPNLETVQEIRNGCDYSTALCEGSLALGQGWRECWRIVTQRLGIPQCPHTGTNPLVVPNKEM